MSAEGIAGEPSSRADAPATDAATTRAVHESVLGWYATFGRDLPWRHTHDPYAILVSEIMLQQTGVERVLPKYHEFLARFPTLQSLAAAPTGAVIRAWAGLGYNTRAVRLQAIARQAVATYGGGIPSTVEELLTLTGIGRYTAGAVACFAFGRDVAFLDTNIRRVVGRIFRGPEDEVPPLGEAANLRLAEEVLPSGHSYAWHQALMDIGATICTLRAPLCLTCPIGDLCRSRFRAGRAPAAARSLRETGPVWEAHNAGPTRRKAGKEEAFVGSTRYYRGRIISALRPVPPGETVSLAWLGTQIKAGYSTADDLPWLAALVGRLAADGLLDVVPGANADPTVWQVALPA